MGVRRGIDDNEFGPVVARLPDPVRQCRKGFADVRAANHDDFGVSEVGVIVRAAVQAKGFLVARAGADHAKPSVVIQVFGLERDPREFADEVALFIGQRHARQHGERVFAVLFLDALNLGDRAVERRIPADRTEPFAFDALDRIEQTVGMVVLQIALDALRAEPAFVEGKFLPRLEADNAIVFYQQLDAALHAAKATVRLHDFVRLVAAGIALRRREIQRRPEPGDHLFSGDG